MNKPTRRAHKIGAWLATPVAILVAAGLIWQSSYAAFTGTTRNSGNSWATGSVALTDDDNGSARFQAPNMVPGDTETKCIAVTATASVAGQVRGYAVNPEFSDASASGVQNYIMVSMKYGTGGGFGSCAGFVEEGTNFPPTSLQNLSTIDSYAKSPTFWTVAPGTQTRTYQMTWTFNTDGLSQTQLNSLQGKRAAIDLQWELQNN